ncbi:MAG: FtsW/RodA/SpoVE family cell cycle protein [Fusobacteriaceae bacterium]|jgi:cell division protein FtsW|nr:FtsW/RodA/SpoVE family cell cycle protein [Fusobacteriaceae bacterium]
MEIKEVNENRNIREIKARQVEMEIAKRKKIRIRVILAVIVILVAVSIINMYSTNILDEKFKGIMQKHVIFLLGAVSVSAVCSNIPYRLLDSKRFSLLILLGSVFALFFMLAGGKLLPGLIPNVKGTKGWIKLGPLGLQPAEFLKLPFIILIAHHLAACERKNIRNLGIVANVFPVFAIFALLIFLQNDTGTCIHYALIWGFMLLFANIDLKYIAYATIFIVCGIGGLISYVLGQSGDGLSGYKLKRIRFFITGLMTGQYDREIGYQVGQSILAFGNGGWKGRGYFNGTQKYGYLPEVRTDFILATIGEEFGFIGLLMVFILFFLLFNVTRSTAMDLDNPFGKYLAVGIGGFIISQMFINLFVVIGLMPVMGVPMPILSSGGTSIFTIFLSLAIITNMNFNNN